MSTVELRRPIATITWPFGPVSADSIRVSAAINRSTTVQFSAFSGVEAGVLANKVLSSDAARLMGQAQVLGLSHRTSPDCSVSLDDGGFGSMELKGYLTGPSYQMSRGSISPTFAFLSEAAVMGNLKMDIYTPASKNKEGDDTRPISSIKDTVNSEANDGNIALRLRELTRLMIDYWLHNKPNEKSDVSREITNQRHEINMAGPLGMWNNTLKNSAEHLENTWLPRVKDNKAFNRKFNGELLSILRGTSRDFMGVVEALMGSFQWMLVPNINGQAGHFIPMTRLADGETKPLQLPATSLSLTGASTYDLLPVQQVLMRGIPNPARDVHVVNPSKQIANGYIMGGFPREAASASGDVVIIPVPFVLSRFIDWTTKKAPSAPRGPGGKDPDYANLQKGMSNLVKDAVQYQDQVVNNMVTEYCRSVYADRALAGTQASVEIPCNLALWPGDRYAVSDLNGDPLFIGFLAAVDHVFTKQGGSGKALTRLQFSHIHFPGFTLPGF